MSSYVLLTIALTRRKKKMITREDGWNIDFGLHVIFDGKKYILMMPNCQNEYPIGGLICEYTRLAPTEVKKLILACENLKSPATADIFIKTFMQLHEKLNDTFLPVIGTLITVEFMNTADDWFNAVRTDRIEEFKTIINADNNDKVKEFILDNTGYSEFGGETVLQLLLTCYYNFAIAYATTKAMFMQVVDEEEEILNDSPNQSIDIITEMYGKYMDMQHIDYRIILTNNGFESLYTMKTSYSLLLFEMAQSINTEANIVKCKNCSHYFVPEGRSDSIYCSYPLQDNKEKTCKDVGAQITRANKEKNDTATKEYRKVYMRYKMMTNRHPEDLEAARKFSKLTTEIKEWRNKLLHGITTTEEFLEWLSRF